ncbi:hypothetical protein [Aquibacillus albus]|uniref:DUF3895 domain-containing protein n=1 Tax=Aquibacillus albus TaxID=1168171 RepID=A0ABS2N3H2_9BACI|nr:hypothetical protein [Aquibacillus albus]MBM7572680.1 hypothetical protein [Aquibacillus albus]
MGRLLTEKEVAELMNNLNDEQRQHIIQFVNQSKKDKWLEVLANKKGLVVGNDIKDLEDRIEDWVLEDILDSGYGNRYYKCECGTPLRFQYIVTHSSENKRYKLGETCFENYTGLSADIINAIKNGLYKVNEERDEILVKFRDGEETLIEGYEGINIPENLLKQIRLGLPLSNKQLTSIFKLLEERRQTQLKREEEEMREKERLEIESFLNTLDTEKRNALRDLSYEGIREIKELISKGINYCSLESYADTEIPEDIYSQMSVGLPLFKEQINRLNELQRVHHQYKRKLRKGTTSVTYEELINRHLETLKKIRDKEDAIPSSLIEDWSNIQKGVIDLREGKDFNYGTWKLKLRNLLIPIKVEEDDYL